MKLEKATISTITSLQEICLSAYTQNFTHHWEENGLDLYLENQFSIKRLTMDLANPNLLYYFIKEVDKPIGFAKVDLAANLDKHIADTVAELEKIYVLPEMKGQGIGKKVLLSIIEEITWIGKKVFFLCVIDTNIAAIKFYEKLGFQFHSKTRLEAPFFKEELKGMHKMYRLL